MSERLRPTTDHDSLHDFVTNNDILLFGITGIGKTTFINYLQREVPVRYVSLGEVTRSAIAHENNTHIASLIEKGGQWPLETIQDLLNPFIANNPSPYVLDGAPRHLDEAEWMRDHMQRRERDQSAIVLTASEEVIRERLRSRNRAARPETDEHIEERIRDFKNKHDAIMGIVGCALSQTVEIDTSDMQPSEIVSSLSKAV